MGDDIRLSNRSVPVLDSSIDNCDPFHRFPEEEASKFIFSIMMADLIYTFVRDTSFRIFRTHYGSLEMSRNLGLAKVSDVIV